MAVYRNDPHEVIFSIPLQSQLPPDMTASVVAVAVVALRGAAAYREAVAQEVVQEADNEEGEEEEAVGEEEESSTRMFREIPRPEGS